MKRTPLKRSRGTVWPENVRRDIEERDEHRCIGPEIRMPGRCDGPVELDHVRVGGTGMKSRSTVDNGASLCAFVHHPLKTNQGKVWRPLILAYITAKG